MPGAQVKNEIPGVISSRVKEYLEVLTLDGTLIPYRTEAARRTDKFDPIKKNKLGYMIYNRKLVVWDDNLALKAVQCRGLFTDPLAWQDIQLCTDTTPCIDVYEIESGLTEDDEALIIEYAKEKYFNLSLRRPADASQIPTRKYVRVNKRFSDGYIGNHMLFRGYPYKTCPNKKRTATVKAKEMIHDHEYSLTQGQWGGDNAGVF